jgi:hypothetical protein
LCTRGSSISSSGAGGVDSDAGSVVSVAVVDDSGVDGEVELSGDFTGKFSQPARRTSIRTTIRLIRLKADNLFISITSSILICDTLNNLFKLCELYIYDCTLTRYSDIWVF